ncbi:hypothetical protein L6452_38572 [Arctium lappa]|uniref:Uncharacterized protein n=1 Tax=Arctium lappa TaxID=4217 RepID=A0ACB8XU12_ARCLA|nr:hypothetical protein L6452_38572 [Arctium lappa]
MTQEGNRGGRLSRREPGRRSDREANSKVAAQPGVRSHGLRAIPEGRGTGHLLTRMAREPGGASVFGLSEVGSCVSANTLSVR